MSLSTAACSLCSLVALHFLDAPTAGPDDAALGPWHLMGYWPLGLVDTARALALTALLFAGPLYESLLVDGGWRQWSRLEPLAGVWTDWPTWRMLVAVRLSFSLSLFWSRSRHISHRSSRPEPCPRFVLISLMQPPL